jgi:hypothetical protein
LLALRPKGKTQNVDDTFGPDYRGWNAHYSGRLLSNDGRRAMKTLFTLVALVLASSPALAGELDPMLTSAAVIGMYYDANCRPGTLSMTALKFMAEAIKLSPQSSVDAATQELKKGERNWGNRTAFCTALQNDEARTGNLHKLDKAIQELSD